MIAFRLSPSNRLEWSNDQGHTWHDQAQVLPPEVLRAWWNFLIIVWREERTAHALP